VHAAIPVTDDGSVHRSLVQKCERIHATANTEAVIYRRSPSDAYKATVLGLNVVGHVVSDEALAALPIQQIVNYRRENRDLLESMWTRMRELASECEADMSSGDFPKQVLATIQSKVRPELEDLERQLAKSYQRLVRPTAVKLVAEAAKAAAPAAPTLSLAALYGLSMGQIVGLGLSSLLVGIGIALPDVVDAIARRREFSKTGLAYLLRVPNEPAPDSYVPRSRGKYLGGRR
jgi:hypothetical protein